MSNTKHFRNVNGYIGGFGDGAKPPDGAIECPAPDSADNVWNGSAWKPKPEVPTGFQLNAFQFFTFMDRIGLTEAMVDIAIDQATSDADMRIEHKRRFRHALMFNRDHPLLVALVPLVGKTEAEIDTAWMAAKDLR